MTASCLRRIYIFAFVLLGLVHCISTLEVFVDGQDTASFDALNSSPLWQFQRLMPLLNESIFDSNTPIQDLHFSGNNHMLIRIDNKLYHAYYDMFQESYNQNLPYATLINPNLTLLSENVLAVSMTVHNNIVFGVYMQENKIFCKFQVAESDTDFTTDCLGFENAPHIKKVDLIAPGEGYLLDRFETLYEFTWEITFSHSIVMYTVSDFSYPIAIMSDSISYIPTNSTVPLEGDGVPHSIASSKEDLSFIVQFDNGTIRGFGFDYTHDIFENECPNYLSGYCEFKFSSALTPMAYTSEIFAHIPESGKLRFYFSESNDGRTFDISLPANMEVQHVFLPAWLDKPHESMIVISSEEESWIFRGLYRGDLFYVWRPVENQFTYMPRYRNVKDLYVYDLETVELYKNGDLVHHKLDADNTIESTHLHSNIVACYDLSIYSDKLLCYDKNNNIYLGDTQLDLDIECDIKAIAYINQPENIIIHCENQIRRYASNIQLSYYNVSQVFFGYNNIALIENEVYCLSSSCCITQDDTDKLLREMSLTGSIIKSISPIHKGDMGDGIIKQIVSSHGSLFFLTDDGQLYTCDMDNPEVDRGVIRAYDKTDILDDVPICDMHSKIKNMGFFFSACHDNSLYYYGIRPNRGHIQDNNGQVDYTLQPIDEIHRFEEDTNNMTLKSVRGNIFGTFLLFAPIYECNVTICQIEEIITDGETVVVPNSTVVIISSPSNVNNSTLIVDHGTTIVVEDTLTITNSTIVYHIPNEDVWNAIQDGDTIVIIDATNGTIEGSFDDIILDLDPSIGESCKKVTVELE